jgi:hypothetical protein
MVDLETLFAHLQREKQRQPPQPAQYLNDLPALRAASAALPPPPPLQQEATDPSAAAAHPLAPELVGCINLIADALLSPPEELFADLGGAPKEPEGSNAAYWEVTALRLRLLCALLPRLGRVELADPSGADNGAQQQQQQRSRADDMTDRQRKPPVIGIVEVVDEDEEEEGGAAAGGAASAAAIKRQRQAVELAAVAFAVAALYAECSSSASSSSDSSDAAGGEQAGGAGGAMVGAAAELAGVVTSPALLELMEDVTADALRLPTPWANEQAAVLSGQLLGVLASLTTSGCAAGAAGDGRPWRRLPAAVVQWLLPRVRDPLFAPHRHTQAQERGSSGGWIGIGGLDTLFPLLNSSSSLHPHPHPGPPIHRSLHRPRPLPPSAGCPPAGLGHPPASRHLPLRPPAARPAATARPGRRRRRGGRGGSVRARGAASHRTGSRAGRFEVPKRLADRARQEGGGGVRGERVGERDAGGCGARDRESFTHWMDPLVSRHTLLLSPHSTHATRVTPTPKPNVLRRRSSPRPTPGQRATTPSSQSC